MTREKANEALVNAMRKHGATAIAKATKALVAAHRSRKPAATDRSWVRLPRVP